MIVTLCSGSVMREKLEQQARGRLRDRRCSVFSFSLSARLRRSLPQRTLSRASSSSAQRDSFQAATRGEQRGFVDHIGQLRAGVTRRAARDDGKVDAFGQLHFLGMNAQDFFAALHVGQD